MRTLKHFLLMIIVVVLFLNISGCTVSDNKIPDVQDITTDVPSVTMSMEDANFLESDGDEQYFWKFEDDNCILYVIDNTKTVIKQLASFPPSESEGYEPIQNSIIDFGICGDWIIASVGHYEGSGNYFYGDFVRMKKDGKELEHFWLTDDDTFIIIDDWIYYDFWTVKGESKEGCYRIRPDGTSKEYMGDVIYSIFHYDEDGYMYGEHDTGKTLDGNVITDFIRCKPDGSEAITLFSWENIPVFDDSYAVVYGKDNIEITKDTVAFTVIVNGYKEGDAWYGHNCYTADYVVNKDGSNLTLLKEEYAHDTIEEELTDSIVYNNNEYGFDFILPMSWEGYKIVEIKWEGRDFTSEANKVEEGPIVYIRNPNWTEDNPIIDIPIMIFTHEQFKAMTEENFHVHPYPINPEEIGQNSKFVFTLPGRFDFLDGFWDVRDMLNDKAFRSTENIN